MIKNIFNIEGMSCAACQATIQKAISKLKGVTYVNVNLLSNNMEVEYDESLLNQDDIINAVNKAGYKAIIPGSEKTTANSIDKTSKTIIIKLIVSAVFTLLLMYVSMGHMLNLPLPSFFMGVENALVFSFTQFLLTIPVIFLNFHYFTNGFKSLIKLHPNMNSLISIGASASFIYGVYAIYRIGFALGHQNFDIVETYMHELYFESVAVILTLVTFGKFLENKSKLRTKDAITKLVNLAPKTAIVERNGTEVTIQTSEIKVNDIIILKKGMIAPCDGIIIDGNGSFDQSNITGESIPLFKNTNEEVICSTVLLNGYLKLKATKVGEDTSLANIIKLVEKASNSKAPISKLVDKVSLVFVPTVISIAIITFIVQFIVTKSFETAFNMGISVLVISCPCALGLATPVAIMVASGKFASNGILVKDAESMEKLHKIKTVVLDKTGTITEGKPKVDSVLNLSNENILSIAYSLENNSEHPLANAIVEYCKSNDISTTIVSNYKALDGFGISGNINKKSYHIGNFAFMNKSIDISKEQNEEYQVYAKEGKTPLFIFDDNSLLGIIAIKDAIKESSIAAIENFRKNNIETIMLTGDNELTAKAIAKEINIDKVYSDVLPEDKQKVVASLKEKGFTAMVGDGVNDAPALMSADLGIAIGSGSDIAIESADVVLIQNNLDDVNKAMYISKKLLNNIAVNLFWAFIYNAIGIVLASGIFYSSFGIKLSPMIGAAAMCFSSLFVVCNALSLNLIKYNKNKEKRSKTKMNNYTIRVEGMMCSHCQKRVQDVVCSFNNTKNVEVSLEDKKVTYSSDIDNTADIIKAINSAGYNASI